MSDHGHNDGQNEGQNDGHNAGYSDSQNEGLTDFGFTAVPPGEKTRRVREVFESVAGRYDIMNDLMSFGVHRLWKRIAVSRMLLRPGHRVLDLAAGTGDLTRLELARVGPTGQVVMSDINGPMLEVGRDRLIDAGAISGVEVVQANAEVLPFADNTFDAVSIAFGLRNVTDKSRALAAIGRVLKPGGRLVVLEFSQVVLPLMKRAYDAYSFNVIPKVGELVTGDGDSYKYLVESIRKHPDQATLKAMMESAGLVDCRYENLSAGVVAMHIGHGA